MYFNRTIKNTTSVLGVLLGLSSIINHGIFEALQGVLIVLYTGEVKRIYCPFMVIAKEDVPPIQKGKEYTVEAVKMTLKLEDVFIIGGRAYSGWYFAVKV
ncbi:hypothetical protein [Draconibacterium halophilum]|uniref:Uncharacterized protein n=1 Tax=Draconibacterium halophilum TaxID=2706887 RepID=A0A6C0REP3_9BACT|nr:hypothetical protein [Draconibacterium halophilum]QIA08342.1 hypothetical protein G0Q07_11735 [Draconibacterium halophilum]